MDRPANLTKTVSWERLGLGQFFESAPFAAIVAEVSTGTVVLWNEAARRLFVGPMTEALASSIAMCIPGVFLTDHRERDERDPDADGGAWSGETEPVDLYAVRANGRLLAVEVERYLLDVKADPKPGSPRRLALVIVRDRTHRPRPVSKTERQLANIVDASDDAIIGVSNAGFITSWNPAATRMYGYPAAEAIGKHVSLLVPPAKLDEFARLVTVLKQGAPVIHHETENVTREQRLITVEVTVSPLWDETGRLTGMAMIARDITERKQRTLALARAQAQLHAIWETTSEAISMIGKDGIILTANPAQANLLGVPLGDVIGASFQIFVLPDQQAGLMADFLSRQKQPGGSRRLETTVLRPDGAIRQVHVVVDDVVLDGVVVAAVASTRDITERVQTEQALRASERRYRLLVEQLPAAVYLLANDAMQTPLYMSPKVEALLGRSVASILAREESWMERVHPEDAARIAARSDDQDTGSVVEFNEQYRFRRGDGSYVWVWDICVPVHDDTGRVMAWQGVMFDVGDQHELRIQLEQARDAAEESNRMKSMFLSTMSHELRTPMNAIIGYAHVLLDGMAGELSADQRDAVREIAGGADRLLGLINDVLDLSRIESGAINLVREPVNIRQLLNSVQIEIAPLAARKGIALVIEIAPRLPKFVCDGFRLRQVVMNLASNAVKFTEHGSVRISARVEDSWLLIAVKDTGIGMEASVLPVIFDEFRQADARTNRKYGGSGLGLAIARRLAELHEGRITVESDIGAGSTFTLALPIEPGEPEQESSAGPDGGANRRPEGPGSSV